MTDTWVATKVEMAGRLLPDIVSVGQYTASFLLQIQSITLIHPTPLASM